MLTSVSMSIDNENFGSMVVDAAGPPFIQSSNYQDQGFIPEYHTYGGAGADRIMGPNTPSSPSEFHQWNSTAPFQFQDLLNENLISWDSSQTVFPSDVQFNDGFQSHPSDSSQTVFPSDVQFNDGFQPHPSRPNFAQDMALIAPLNEQQFFNVLSPTTDFSSMHGLTLGKSPSSVEEEQQLSAAPADGNFSEFPYDANILPKAGFAVQPGSLARADQVAEQQLPPLTGSYPTLQTRGFPIHSPESECPPPSAKHPPAPDFKKDPEAMRRSWMDDCSRFIDDTKVLKFFGKRAKEKVATMNTLKASAARRKGPARFKCSIEHCGADFTRKHNLENHLKSHCGVTDQMCAICGKGFTTIPVCKRHQRSCEKTTPSSSTMLSPKAFLDAVTAQPRV